MARKISKKKYKQTYENRDKGGSTGGGFINWGVFKNKPDFFETKEGVQKFNIIPFEIKSKNHPEVKRGEAEIGELDMFLDIWVHRKIGPGEVNIVCPKKNYNKPCPICAKGKEVYNSDGKDAAKPYNATRRSLFNVQPVVKGKPEAMQVMDVSHYCFTKLLTEEANECADGEDIISYADIEDGRTIKVRWVEEQLGTNKFIEASRIDFEEREVELDDDLIDKALSFDLGINVLTEEQIEAAMYGMDEEEKEDEEEKPNRSKGSAKSDRKQEKEDEVEEDEVEEEEVDEEAERREKIRAEKERKIKEAQAISQKSEKSSKPECFGKSVDELKACDTCKYWDDCMEASGK